MPAERGLGTCRPANIVEGCYRDSPRSLAQFLRIALGSAGELEYYVILASDLKLLQTPELVNFAQQVADIKRVVAGLLRAVIDPTVNGEAYRRVARSAVSRVTARLTAILAASTVRMPNRWAISGRLHCTSIRATIISRSLGVSFVRASR